MRLFISVKLKAKKEFVKKIDDTHFTVAVKEPALRGRANMAVIKALADFLRLPSSTLCLISGHTSRRKVIIV